MRFSRKSFPELYDVTIRTEDGVELFGHRCVLAARLDYFRCVDVDAMVFLNYYIISWWDSISRPQSPISETIPLDQAARAT
jgi:hypothetical protein